MNVSVAGRTSMSGMSVSLSHMLRHYTNRKESVASYLSLLPRNSVVEIEEKHQNYRWMRFLFLSLFGPSSCS